MLSLFDISFLRLVLLSCLMTAGVSAEAELQLHISKRSDGLSFRLAGATGKAPWVLQHRSEHHDWENLLFMEEGDDPQLEIQWGVLSDPNAKAGLFRAVQLAEDDSLLRQFLSERAKWRLTGRDSYHYELIQNFGSVSWHGFVTVADDALDSFETLHFEPFFDTPTIPTIDGLFERVARAMALNAAEIRVTWNKRFGYPESCSIDYDVRIADEEEGWTVRRYAPAP